MQLCNISVVYHPIFKWFSLFILEFHRLSFALSTLLRDKYCQFHISYSIFILGVRDIVATSCTKLPCLSTLLPLATPLQDQLNYSEPPLSLQDTPPQVKEPAEPDHTQHLLLHKTKETLPKISSIQQPFSNSLQETEQPLLNNEIVTSLAENVSISFGEDTSVTSLGKDNSRSMLGEDTVEPALLSHIFVGNGMYVYMMHV